MCIQWWQTLSVVWVVVWQCFNLGKYSRLRAYCFVFDNFHNLNNTQSRLWYHYKENAKVLITRTNSSGSFVLSWVRRRLWGCIRLLVGASVLQWVHRFLSWVHHHWSCCGCVGLVVGALVSALVHWSCRGCNGLVVRALLSSVHWSCVSFLWQFVAVV